MAKKLYVGNLSYDVTEDELSQAFTRCGQVSGVQIIKDRESGRSKGFAFVEMTDDDEAEQAINTMTGQDLRGRPLTVDHARERSRSGGGSRGGHRRD